MAKVNIVEKKLTGGKVSLLLDYYQHGQRKKETLKLYVYPSDKRSKNPILKNAFEETYAKALYLKHKKEMQLAHGEHDLPTKTDKTASFIHYFEQLAESRNQNWQSVRRHLYDYTKGKLTFGNVTEEWLHRFQEYLRTKIKDVTVCSYMGIITTCLNQAVREKVILANPATNIRKVRGKEIPPKYLTREQIEVLEQNTQNIPQWFTDPFLFSCYTGLRLSDVESLTWAEIVPTAGKHGQFTLIKEQTKTGETVVIPLSKQAMSILQRQNLETKDTRAHDLVFKLKSRTQTKRYIHRWRTQSGIYFTYHSSRHTFGTMLQTAGVDINTTSKLMGHKSISMTLRYAKVVDSRKEAAISQLNSFLG
ncbi:site-specific integrase [Pontibacter actiniarum]|uniref:Tyr recombinase domain-containing protein n=1 Tax=Pontibacter actiniarum TaxID=323450 RepID=A0A1X9YUL5_9BACT|nr:site-specific integrase [Pontibacter actiniarum]ARS36585.1 hypothetical protein CA264_14800 [Pontibacter actiniarum]